MPVDRETIVKTILEDEVTIVNGPIQPLSWAYEANVPAYNHDPAKAEVASRRSGMESRRSRCAEKTGATLIHRHHAGWFRDQRERLTSDSETAQGRWRRHEGEADGRDVDQRRLVQRQLRGDAALVANGCGSGDDAVLRVGPRAAGGTEYQLLS
jgi:hypothetical protein